MLEAPSVAALDPFADPRAQGGSLHLEVSDDDDDTRRAAGDFELAQGVPVLDAVPFGARVSVVAVLSADGDVIGRGEAHGVALDDGGELTVRVLKPLACVADGGFPSASLRPQRRRQRRRPRVFAAPRVDAIGADLTAVRDVAATADGARVAVAATLDGGGVVRVIDTLDDAVVPISRPTSRSPCPGGTATRRTWQRARRLLRRQRHPLPPAWAPKPNISSNATVTPTFTMSKPALYLPIATRVSVSAPPMRMEGPAVPL